MAKQSKGSKASVSVKPEAQTGSIMLLEGNLLSIVADGSPVLTLNAAKARKLADAILALLNQEGI